MTTPDLNGGGEALAKEGLPSAFSLTGTLAPPYKSPIPAKTKFHNIRVSPAEERAQTAGPNAVAQERRRSWFVHLLIIIRKPAVARQQDTPARRVPVPGQTGRATCESRICLSDLSEIALAGMKFECGLPDAGHWPSIG
jgi:hypothetical protein